MHLTDDRRTLWRLLLAGLTLLIVHASLYPWDLGSRPVPAIPFSALPRLNRFFIRDSIANVLFYAPFGFAYVLASRRRGTGAALPATAFAALLSAALETIQATQATRSSSILDLLCNTSGAAAAALATALYRDRFRRERTPSGSLGRPAAWALAGLWLCYKFYPGLPLLRRTRLAERAGEALGTPLSFWTLALYAAEWLAFARILEMALGMRTAALAVVATIASVPARVLFEGPVPGSSEFLGAAAGSLLWANLAAGKRRGTKLAAGAAVTVLILYALSPFDFQGPPAGFTWMPFYATLESNRTPAIATVLAKLFRYGAAFWLLRRAGMGSPAAALWLASGAFVMEVLQKWLPGRSPEITEAALALFACGGIGALDSRRGVAAEPSHQRAPETAERV